MQVKKHIIRFLAIFIVLVMTATMIVTPVMAATGPEINASIDQGLAWLATQQLADGSWYSGNKVAHTALAVLKFEHHAIFGLGISPFDAGYMYHTNVENGLNYLFSRATTEGGAPLTSPHGNPDPDGDGGIIIYQNVGERMYEHGAAMMAIAASDAPARVVNVAGSIVNGWTYQDVLQDMVDTAAWAQQDDGVGRGGWRYAPNSGADNSVSGYPTLGLGYAQAPSPWGFGLTVPAFVKTELSIWIDYIQNDVDGDAYDGGSGYHNDTTYVNTYKTGNLLYEMALVGDTAATPRVQDAVNYLVANWNAAYTDGSFTAPGWKGTATYSHYHAAFAMMKGLEALGINNIGGIDWYQEIADELVPEQQAAGNWPSGSYGGTPVLETAWALLAMQRAVPPPNLSLTPPTATNNLGTTHTLIATLVDNAGAPVSGETITFAVTAGPNAGKSGTDVTGADGKASWSYTDTAASNGDQDTIVATGGGVTSNQAKKNWVGVPLPSVPGMTGWGILATIVALGLLMPLSLRRQRLIA